MTGPPEPAIFNWLKCEQKDLVLQTCFSNEQNIPQEDYDFITFVGVNL